MARGKRVPEQVRDDEDAVRAADRLHVLRAEAALLRCSQATRLDLLALDRCERFW